MNIHLASQIVPFCVKNLRNSLAIMGDHCLDMNDLGYNTDLSRINSGALYRTIPGNAE
ncbi:MAG: hypothetical protein IEMM0001_1743 [bacterium]|nr:MAG: hypothetical protein IEMM0001_1743 [bacterium]